MLFGTTDRGVLLYDGVRFRTISLKSSQFVRSMEASERGVVYIGRVGDFGRLVPLRNGELRYESLVETIQDSVPNFQDIHRVYAYGQFVFFCDKREFFIYNEVTGQTVFSFGTDAFVGNDDAEFQFFLEHNDKEWSKWMRNGEAQYMNLSEGSYVLRVRTRDAYGRVSLVTEYRFSIAPPFYRTWWAHASYVIITGLLLYLGLWWNSRCLIAEQRRLSKIVEERTKEVVAQKEQIEKQKEEIESSIEYASRIQQAMLPRQELMGRLFPEHFMLYLPRDVVSGDFYWMTHIGRKKVCCIADCTGHGVPGGFMSMLGSSLLHRVTQDKQNDLGTAEIFERVRELLISSLHQSTSEKSNKDGMDLVLFIIDEDTNELQYSGALNPLVIVRTGEATVLKADRMPVGIYTHTASSFTSEKFQLEEGDMVYAYSDGYQDQFGGPKKMKFMSKNLWAFLAKISNLPMEEQREALYENFLTWMGDSNPRLDDVVIFGMRVVPWGRADDEE